MAHSDKHLTYDRYCLCTCGDCKDYDTCHCTECVCRQKGPGA